MTKLTGWGTTDVGLVRENNEDAWLLEPALGVAIVADGMGGAACGEVASAITIETVVDYLKSPGEELAPDLLMKEAIRAANRRVLDRAGQEPNCDGMGSTIVVAQWNLPELLIANVGDSRAYLWRDGKLAQLSYDQTLANELRVTLGLTDEQMSSYTNRNILTMAVGSSEDILVQTRSETLAPGDEILLCSDGLYGPIGDARIAEILAQGSTMEETVQNLIERAKQDGSEDNITAVLLRWNHQG